MKFFKGNKKEVYSKNTLLPSMREFYKGTMRFLLVVLKEFPEFLSNMCLPIVEEISDEFT
jgi:hypothetical protein